MDNDSEKPLGSSDESDPLLKSIAYFVWSEPEVSNDAWLLTPGALMVGKLSTGQDGIRRFLESRLNPPEDSQDISELNRFVAKLYDEMRPFDELLDYIFLEDATVFFGGQKMTVDSLRVKVSSVSAWGLGEATLSPTFPD